MDFHNSTDELLNILKGEKKFSNYIRENQREFISLSLEDCLNQLLSRKKLDKAAVVRDSGLDRVYAYQLFNGQKKNPSRDKLLAIFIAMKLTLEEIQTLLKHLKYPLLYPRDVRDSMIIFSIQQGYNVMNTNEKLEELQFPHLN